MINYKKHIIQNNTLLKDALVQLDELGIDAILFVIDRDGKLIGSITDGDIRRSLINNGFNYNHRVEEIIQPNPKFITKGELDINKIIKYRDSYFRIIPILDVDKKVVSVINFRKIKSYLPIDAVIMAGGKGTRLLPLTKTTPKPLLKVGNKPIIEHNIDRLTLFGIDDFWISINYLGDQIKNYLGSGKEKNINIYYVNESKPLGTLGAVSKIKNFKHNHVLITNSDILTNMNYERFFLDFINQNADMSIVTVPYEVGIPYAVLETSDKRVLSFKEKPTYTYYSNAGIYLVKKSILDNLPVDEFYNATDLIDKLIKENKKVCSYPLTDYWLDIGKHSDFERANNDINNIKF